MTNQNNEKSKNGKRIALILLALLLIAAIAFGAYTYSKYVSSDNGSGSATVAKWGFTVEMENGDNAGFSTKYNDSGVADANGKAIVADITTEGNVVAPGANGNITFSLSGSAEVAAEAKILITQNTEISLSFDSGDDTYTYYPIVYTLTDNTETEGNPVKTGTLADIITYLTTVDKELFSADGKSFAANSEKINHDYTLSWEWAFELGEEENLTLTADGSDSTINLSAEDVNKLDTYLGQIAANVTSVKDSDQTTTLAGSPCTVKTSTAETVVSFTVSVSIAQVQVPNA